MRKLLAAALLLVPFIAAPPAQAANSYTLDCSTATGNLAMTENQGDTFTFDAPNCQVQGFGGYITTSMFTSISATPPYMWIGPETFTANNSNAVFIIVNPVGNPGNSFTVSLTVNAAPAPNPPAPNPPAPAAEPASAGPNPLGQGLPVPASGDCRDINDLDAGWATDLKGGWFIGWSTWRREDGTVFHDGWVCKRTIEYVNGEWRVKPLTDEPRSLEEKNREIERLQQGS